MGLVLLNIEEPLSSNERLTALNEKTGQLELALFSINELCRYSYGHHLPHNPSSSFATLIEWLATMLCQKPYWIMAWQSGGENKFRSRVLRSKLQNAGWDLCDKAGLTLGMTGFPDKNLLCDIAPINLDPRIAGWAVMLGAPSSSQALLNPPFFPSLAMLSITHRLQPSKEFLYALYEQNLGIAYMAKDDLGQDQLIVVTPKPIILSPQRFSNLRIVD